MRNRIKKLYLQIKIKRKSVKIASDACVSLDSEFEGYNRIGCNTFYAGHIGYASYIGENSHINADIGRFSCIGSRVIVARGNHPTSDWASLHPAFYSTAKQCGMSFVDQDLFAEKKQRVQIGNDVWVGDSAILMDGITVGNGAVIAAGAVVTKDVEPYSIVGGVPAKVIRYRFPDKETVRELQRIEWWNKPVSWIKEHAILFQDVDLLLEYFSDRSIKEGE